MSMVEIPQMGMRVFNYASLQVGHRQSYVRMYFHRFCSTRFMKGLGSDRHRFLIQDIVFNGKNPAWSEQILATKTQVELVKMVNYYCPQYVSF